jgi:hypothetical protein
MAKFMLLLYDNGSAFRSMSPEEMQKATKKKIWRGPRSPIPSTARGWPPIQAA